MVASTQKLRLDMDPPANGKKAKCVLKVYKGDRVDWSADVDMGSMAARDAAVDEIATRYRRSRAKIKKELDDLWARRVNDRQQAMRWAQDAAERAPAGAAWAGAEIPRGYAITPQGSVVEVSDNGPAPITRSPVWLVAFTRDESRESWGALLAWLDRDGCRHEAAVSSGRFHEQSLALPQELATGGLVIVPGQERALLRYLGAFDTPARFRSAPRVGWAEVDGAVVYVLPREVIGGREGERIVFQPERHAPTVTTMHARGTLDSWRDTVARPLAGNPMLQFGLAAAFAGPLLKPAGLEGGGFHLFGTSTIGKTTGVQVAASVWGCGADPAEAEAAFVRKWNTTGNAMEALAAAHNDCLLALDEIGEAQAREFGKLVYQLAGGQGKARLDSGANLKAVRTWRVLTLSTGETPAQAVIEAEGRRARAGQLVRMVDVPATGEDGGMVRDSHGMTAADFVHAMKRACAAHYGTAGPAFVRALRAEHADAQALAGAVRERLDAAEAGLMPPGASDEMARVVRRFALVAVAGRLAALAGILPYSQEEVTAAVTKAISRWRGTLHQVNDLERALAQLRDFVLRNREARFRALDVPAPGDTPPVNQPVVRDLAGYIDAGQGLYLFTPEGFREALVGYSSSDVARHLGQRGWLVRNEDERLSSKHRVPGFADPIRLYAVRAAFLGEVREA
jgi:uncharacterized protein (DUF927 family)